MDENRIEDGESHRDVEVARALISVHPGQSSIAVAVSSDLRVFDLVANCALTLVDDSGGALHKDSIRAIRYGANGKLFVSAGDDKLVKIWSAESWRCICNVNSEKRVNAVAISSDGSHICFADKFGVVWVVNLDGVKENQPAANKKAAPLLAHYCSIITSLEFSPDGRYIVSADRDFKIRVTVFPNKPLNGAHEIQTFCLGHTEFVSCLGFLFNKDFPQGFLVSGSGDSTVRLWDVTSGSLLDTCEVVCKEGQPESNGSEPAQSTVTDICTIPECTVVAVATQSLQGIMLLNCDLSAQKLSIAKVILISGGSFIPTSLGSSSSGELLWMVTGASLPSGCNLSSFSRLKVLSGFKRTNEEVETKVLDDNQVPGGANLLEKLQGSLCVEEKLLCLAAEAVKTAMSNLLVKKHYSTEKRELRKKTRNDKRLSHQPGISSEFSA